MTENYIQIKKEVLKTLETEDISNILKSLSVYPPTKIISFLIGAFLHPDEVVRWKAVIAFGHFTAEIAKNEMERARIVIRRLMWMLNEESGSMAWGVPEGFAEALYNCKVLKDEYLPIFVSYIWNAEKTGKYKADNFLEFPPAQRGVIWGIGRLAEKYKKELWENKAPFYIKQILKETKDSGVMFLSLWSLNKLKPFPKDFSLNNNLIEKVFSFLLKKNYSFLFFDGKRIYSKSIKELQKEFFSTS